MIKFILIHAIFLFSSHCFLISSKKLTQEKEKQNMLSLLYIADLQNNLNKLQLNTDFFSLNTKELEIQVLYEIGSEPFTEEIFPPNANAIIPWHILEENLKSIYSQRSHLITLTIPKTLNQMKLFSEPSDNLWTLEEIKSLIERKADTTYKPHVGKIFIVFLNGYYQENGKKKSNISGINIIGTPYIAIFSKSIHSNGKDKENLSQLFKEQATVVHETGHALGLVNKGIPITSDHHDHSNGFHCSNQFCVMYWASSNNNSIGKFLSNYIQTGSINLFGEECLKDIREFKMNNLQSIQEDTLYYLLRHTE